MMEVQKLDLLGPLNRSVNVLEVAFVMWRDYKSPGGHVITQGSRVVGLVLAAGGSSRMSHPKPLLDLRGSPLIIHHIEALSKLCDEVHIVLGYNHEEVLRILPSEVIVTINSQWSDTHPRESLLMALKRLESSDLVFVTPVDVPPAPLKELKRLYTMGAPAVLSHKGIDGHPVFINTEHAIPGLSKGTLREYLVRANRTPTDWSGCLCNLNTPQQWETWCSQFEEH